MWWLLHLDSDYGRPHHLLDILRDPLRTAGEIAAPPDIEFSTNRRVVWRPVPGTW